MARILGAWQAVWTQLTLAFGLATRVAEVLNKHHAGPQQAARAGPHGRARAGLRAVRAAPAGRRGLFRLRRRLRRVRLPHLPLLRRRPPEAAVPLRRVRHLPRRRRRELLPLRDVRLLLRAVAAGGLLLVALVDTRDYRRCALACVQELPLYQAMEACASVGHRALHRGVCCAAVGGHHWPFAAGSCLTFAHACVSSACACASACMRRSMCQHRKGTASG